MLGDIGGFNASVLLFSISWFYNLSRIFKELCPNNSFFSSILLAFMYAISHLVCLISQECFKNLVLIVLSADLLYRRLCM